MTPRGVEHTALTVFALVGEPVEKPMTPRGVEHDPECYRAKVAALVEKPMTPRGVEHMTFAAGGSRTSSGGEADDAERR